MRRTCSFAGCGRLAHSHGLCNGHRQQLHRGRPLATLRGDITAEQRFWRLVNVGEDDACWTWTGTKNRTGYGYFKAPGRRHIYAHRFSYELAHGPIPDGMVACHHCDNPPCVNPAHLFLGTYSDNTQDMLSKGRGNPITKLTAADVQQIRAEYVQGAGASLARRYGVSQQLISAIINRRVWR